MSNTGYSSIEPRVSKLVIAVVLVYGLLASSLSIAAEFSKAEKFTYLMDAERYFRCHYPKNSATTLAFSAATILFVGIFAAHSYVGWLVFSKEPKYIPTKFDYLIYVSLGLAWISFLTAFVLLIYGGIQNGFHGEYISGSLSTLHCPMVKNGLFLGAAFCCILCVTFAILYYILGMRQKIEAWKAAKIESPPPELIVGKLSTVPEEP